MPASQWKPPAPAVVLGAAAPGDPSTGSAVDDARTQDAARHGLLRPIRVWPSDLPADEHGHPLDLPYSLPHWWLLVTGKGQRPDAEQMAALAAAHQTITRYRGYADLSDEGLAFTRAAVRDALSAAPQPVTKTWVRYTLSPVAGLVSWCEQSGQPLIRQHVFSSQVRHRWLTVVRSSSLKMGRASYQARLDLVANALLNAGDVVYLDRPALVANDVMTPYSLDEESALFSFGHVMRPVARQHRYRVLTSLAFGLGAPRRDISHVRPEHVRRDADGVHVLLGDPASGGQREVTCLAAWEPDLLAVVDATPAGRPLIAPDRDEALPGAQVDATIQNINRRLRPPVPFILRRARNTWMVRHLALGTPLPTLMRAANVVSLVHLEELLPFVTEATPSAARQALRGSRP